MNKKKMVLTIVLSVIMLVVILGVSFFVFSCRAKQEKKDGASLYQLVQGGPEPSLVIDGKIDGGEWDSFQWSRLASGEKKMTVYLTNDDQNLYLAIKDERATTAGNFQNNVLLCFLPDDLLKVGPGRFKTVKIYDNGTVLWKDWAEMEKLSARYVHRTEDYSEDLGTRLQANEAVRVYNGKKVVDGDEKGVYALFARNITNLPDGLVAKTSLNGYRTYEAKIPLSLLGVEAGQVIRVFGSIHDSASSPQNVYYPNTWTKFYVSTPFIKARIPAQN